MMGLPPFALARPTELAAAIELLRAGGPRARLLAGGTDLLVNLKHRLHEVDTLISLEGLAELRGLREEADGTLVLGANLKLVEVAADPRIRLRATALAEAAGEVAHPQARQMGTLGGNVCLDVRCRWVNRSPAWRASLGGCLKSEGEVCHVVPKGKNCVAALSGDTLPALAALRAEAVIAGPAGERRVPVEDLRGKDGREPLTLGPGEILVSLRIPPAAPLRRSAYQKWAVRGAVDFPLVGVGLSAEVREGATLHDIRIAVGVLGPRPKIVTGLQAYEGERADAALGRAIAERVCRQCTPLPNVLSDPDYRRRLLGVLVQRQIAAWGE
ncbi:MAG: FAD binding domain-containing protein [Deltaproteobacteria bacterium]|nr:FAD binding domain-containing protein [Deltaproteobacteria bacterium]